MLEILNRTRGCREKLTDLYLIIILFLFPLFPGFSGYEDITFAKYAFFLAATGLWLAVLVIVSVRGRLKLRRPSLAQGFALAFLAVCGASALLSPYRMESLLGAGRFDGLLTIAVYVLCFLGVSAFARPRPLHAAALAAGTGLCCAVGVMQLFGRNPLGLFPGDLGYFDNGTLYSGVYLGTIGNTNILDAVLCVALPLCFALYILGHTPLFLLPLLPGCFLLAFSGGSGAALAFAAFALAAGPLLLTSLPRLRRGLRGAAAVLLPAGLALTYHPEYADRVLTPRFALTPAAGVVLAASVVLFIVSLLPAGRFDPTQTALRRFFLIFDAAVILAGLAVLWFWPGTAGTVYELSRALHGQLEDGYGSSRVLIWRKCLELVPERPLLGGGPGTLALRQDIEFSRYVPETGRTLTASVDNAHNIYLGYLVNCGALGLAAYLGLLVCALRLPRVRRRTMAPALALAVFCAAVHGLFGLGLCLSEPVFWAALGMLCARGDNSGAWGTPVYPAEGFSKETGL